MTYLETAQQILDRLSDPIIDLRYLLSRGYRRAHSLRFVGDHHQLDVVDRNVLERVVFAREEATHRRRRVIDCDQLEGSMIAVDGYNVLISLECLLTGAPLFRCDDGVVRDIAARRGLLKQGSEAREILSLMWGLFLRHHVDHVLFIFDEQVSRSGELAAVVRNELGRVGLDGNARTESRADRALTDASSEAIIATSDRVIIDAAQRVFDVVAELAEGRGEVGRLPRHRPKE